MSEQHSSDDLVTIHDIAARLDIAESTAWLLIKRVEPQRYRMPGRGKTAFFRWGEVEAAYKMPIPVPVIKKAEPQAV